MRLKIETGAIYHVYNRGVDKRNIFDDRYDLKRFLDSMREFNVVEPTLSLQVALRPCSSPTTTINHEKLVNILCYCLNPNHFHLILEQLEEGGVSEFMKRIGVGYTRYFNIKQERSGSLFQGKYKYKLIESEDDLKYVSAYVNLNDRIHGYRNCSSWTTTSSYEQYIGDVEEGRGDLYRVDNASAILDLFKDKREYKKYAEKTCVEIRQRRAEIKEML